MVVFPIADLTRGFVEIIVVSFSLSVGPPNNNIGDFIFFVSSAKLSIFQILAFSFCPGLSPPPGHIPIVFFVRLCFLKIFSD